MIKQFLSFSVLLGSVFLSSTVGATCNEITASNADHVSAGRAVVCNYWYACAVGSGDNLGMNGSYTTSTVYEDPQGYFSKGSCPEITSSAPEVGSWALQLDEPNYIPVNINVSDEDSDLQSLTVKVINSRNSDEVTLNCPFSLKDGSTIDYRSGECDVFTAPDWGTYTFTPIAEDSYGNVVEGESSVQNNKVGSAVPVMSITSYGVDGNTLTITGTSSDLDGDVEAVVIGVIPAYGALCDGTDNFTCIVDLDQFPADTEIHFIVYARDSVDNQSSIQEITIMTPAEQQYVCVTTTNQEHAAAGRATEKYGILYYASGSNDYLGMGSTVTSLQPTAAGTWEKVTSCD